jgi:hypothetical protein
MSLFDIVIFMLIIAVAIQFWRIRGISERANQHCQTYCQQHNLQLISVALKSTRITTEKGKLDWRTTFAFEFSATGDDAYIGECIMSGKRVTATQIPAHRIN